MKSKIKRKITFKPKQRFIVVKIVLGNFKPEVYDPAKDVFDYFLEGLKNIDKPVFKDECYVTIEVRDENEKI